MYNSNRQSDYSLNTLSTKGIHKKRRFSMSFDWRNTHTVAAYVPSLHLNGKELGTKFGILAECLVSIAGHTLFPYDEGVRKKQSKEFQRHVAKRIKKTSLPDPTNRIRHNLDQRMEPKAGGPTYAQSAVMKIIGPPQRAARRTHAGGLKLSSLVPPRVCSTVFHTVWNAWCTSRRFQQCDNLGSLKKTRKALRNSGVGNMCRIGCGHDAQESIEK